MPEVLVSDLVEAVGVIALVLLGFVVLSFLGVFLVGLEASLATRRREREAARAWEHERADPGLVHRFGGPPFDAGRDPLATDVYRGVHQGRRFVTFRYSADYGVAGTEERREYAVLAVDAQLSAPPLALVPTRWPDLSPDVGDPATEVDHQQAQLEPWFVVRSPDPDHARAVLARPGVRGALLGVVPPSAWRIGDGRVLLVRPGHETPTQIVHRLELVARLVESLPQGQ